MARSERSAATSWNITRQSLLLRILVTLSCLSAASLPVTGLESDRTESTINWEESLLEITVTRRVSENDRNNPAQLYRVQRELEESFPSLLFSELLSLQIDSTRTIRDAILTQPELAAEIRNLADRAERGFPRPARDFRSVTQSYRVPLFPDVASLFLQHQHPFRMERVLSWVPTREFTGLLIYAAEELPLRGTEESTRIVPALLPEIFDTDLRPVLEQDMLLPQAINRWGVAAYTETCDEEPWKERIGTDPLRIMARQAFGVHPTDIIISREDADRILASPHNRELLRQGRILVILAPGMSTGH